MVRGTDRCPAHPRHAERRKDPAQAAFYSSMKWRRLRAQVKREQPICAICRVRPSQVVDHVDGDWRNNERINLRGLCRPCEARRTGQQHAAKASRCGSRG